MNQRKPYLGFALLLLLIAGSAYALNFNYFSDHEHTVFGDVIKFWHLDSLAGVIRSNDSIKVSEPLPDTNLVITSCDTFITPNWSGPLPSNYITHAPNFPFPDSARVIRQRAIAEGFYFDQGDTMQARVQIRRDTLRVWWARIGTTFDSTGYQNVIVPDTAYVYFRALLQISGTVSTVLAVCASGRIGLEDNIRYVHSSGSPYYNPTPGHAEKFALISEGEIKVLNTWANGRENSSGQGMGQSNQNLTSIALNGIYVALNESFTFENQNVGDSGYVCTLCGCQPGTPGLDPPTCGAGGNDDRGTIWLSGSLMQARRGYVHRTCCTSTGYAKRYQFDPDLEFWNFGLFDSTLRENTVEPTALGFGDVLIGETFWDTLNIINDFVPILVDSVPPSVSPLTIVAPTADSLRFVQKVIVGFESNVPGNFSGTLSLYNAYYNRWLFVPWAGHAISVNDAPEPVTPHEFSLSVFPNPFNAEAQFRFTLPSAERMDLKLYDIMGRAAASILNADLPAGTHTASFNGSSLASGVYFARLSTPSHLQTIKLLLLK